MTIPHTSILCVAAALLAAGTPQDPKPDPPPRKQKFAVVVNPANEVEVGGEEVRPLVRKLFLKELTRWPDGPAARPYDRERGSDEHVAFLRAVLDLSEAEVARHWLKQKNLNGTTPPNAVDTDRMLLKYVARTPGAFGIVKIDAIKDTTTVRVLLKF